MLLTRRVCIPVDKLPSGKFEFRILGKCMILPDTPLKANMTLENPNFQYRKYIFKCWVFHCQFRFRGCTSKSPVEILMFT